MNAKSKVRQAQVLHSQIIALSETVERTAAKLNAALNKYKNMAKPEYIDEYAAQFDDRDRVRLNLLNQRLAEVEEMTQRLLDVKEAEAHAALNNPNNRLHDVIVDASATLHLRDDDPAYSIRSNNVIAAREIIHIPQAARETNGEMDFAETDLLTVRTVDRPHCYLFHDFTENEYGVDRPKMKLSDCLRAGVVLVDVKVTYQYWIDIETGNWHSLCELGKG